MLTYFQNLRFSLRKQPHPLYALATHIILAGIVYVLFYMLNDDVNLPNNTNLLNWDAIWYHRIKDLGYYYNEGQCPLAFFPLFPFLWKFTMLDQVGISLLNLLIFLISFYFIARQLALDFLTTLLFLSTPSLFFCALPYTESVFFLGSTLILIGFEKNKQNYIIIGMLIAGLTRAVNVTFLPAILFTYVALNGYKKIIVKPILIQCTIILIAIFITLYVQYLYTGQWFVFFKVQKAWNRSLQLPTLPFTTLNGSATLWIDGIALFICLLAFIDTITAAIKVFIYQVKFYLSPGVLFSMAYLSVIGILAVFFSGIWPNQTGTSLMSLNRYVFGTPYFIFYIYYKIKKDSGKNTWLESLILLAIVILCLCGYQKLEGLSGYATILYFGTVAVYIFTYIHFQKDKKVLILLYCINTIAQLILVNRFLSFEWVG